MPLTPVPGVTRLRSFQLGKETTFKTAVAATRRMPWTFAPTTDLHWTTPTADTGTLSPAIAPYRLAYDVTGAATGQLFSNDVPTVISAGMMGNLSLTGAGTAKTITATPAETSQDVFDTYSGQWYDDASGDAFGYAGGVISDFKMDYPQDQGPIMLTANWRFASVTYPQTPTAGLAVDTSPTPLFCGDTYIFANDTAGAIGTSQLVDQVYGLSINYNNNLDVKRFVNGNSTRFDVDNYGRGERLVEPSFTFAKATAAIAEATKWIGASPTERFLEIRTVSTVVAQAGVFHTLTWRIPGYWFTRAETAINTNTGFTLGGHQIYDQTLLYAVYLSSISTRAAL